MISEDEPVITTTPSNIESLADPLGSRAIVYSSDIQTVSQFMEDFPVEIFLEKLEK